MKKRIISAVTACVCLASFAGCGSKPATPSSGGASGGENAVNKSEINVCIASEPGTLDPALNTTSDGASMDMHLFAGLAKWEQDASGNTVLAPDAATELPEGVVNSDGSVTYTYTLRDDAKWSDGKPLTANDFVFAWNRAASPAIAADYCYMFEVIKGYDEMWETADDGSIKDYDAKLDVVAKDDKTLEVTIENAVPYWNELLAFPGYYPVREDVVANENWAADPSTYISNGPYKMTAWEHNSVITLEKNDQYFDADNITMEKINFYLSDDANNMLTNFENRSWQFINQVPTNEMANLKTKYPDEYHVVGTMGTYFADWNVNFDLLPASSTLEGEERAAAEAEIRTALSMLIDRRYIVDNIVQGGQIPASSFVAMGITDLDGRQFYENAGGNEGYAGYYNINDDAYTDTWNKAIDILKKYYTYDEASGKFTDVPQFTYMYNTSEGHKAIAENIQGIYAGIGINMNLENQEWATFVETRQAGDFVLARDGWLADYNDPIAFLDMWTTTSGNNNSQLGKGDDANKAVYTIKNDKYGIDLHGTWAETYDVLIDKIKDTTDDDTRYGLMHLAEDTVMQTGCIMPMYYYTQTYMLDSSVKGFVITPLGYVIFKNCRYE